MSSETTALTLQEILRQPASWQEALECAAQAAPDLKAILEKTQPDVVLFTGCGTSYYLSIAAAGFFQDLTGRPARAVPASEYLLSRGTFLPDGQRALLVAFSRSGETTETITALQQHRAQGLGPALGITCRAGSALDKAGDLTVTLPGSDDRSVVMTSSFSSMLLTSLALAAAIGGNDEVRRSLEGLPALLRAELAGQQARGRELGEDLTADSFVFLGLSPFFGIACEAMLKMKEMTQVPCEAYSPLEFRHGPISIVKPSTVTVLMGSDRARQQELAVLEDIRRLGGRTLDLAADTASLAADTASLPEPTRAVLWMPLLQMTAYYRAMTLGRDPDAPQHLTRVVTLNAAALLPSASAGR